MAKKNNEIKFALEFPQGLVLFLKGDRSGDDIGGVYFQPKESADVFIVWGERKELFGKHAISVAKDRETGSGGYSVVYEFAANGTLADARLVSATATVPGVLADQRTVQALNDALAQDKITLHGRQDTALSKVFNVASFPDGKMLIQISDKDELYLGTPGNYKKLDATLMAQGGNSMYYKLATGEYIELPYSFGRPGQNDIPKYNGQELVYLDVKFNEDPAKFGLSLPGGAVPLDPFSPQLKKAPKP